MDSRYGNCIRWLGGSELHSTDGKAFGAMGDHAEGFEMG